ncbi:Glutamate--tRNA ligase, chloroplastic/mitochondrial [Turnera subulata]|uniref:Glutamate--tRNA ligase, chloroplastic/mitochondrial n=1 Tax=Turnera subulata TaxID=218843 RepID=A0A9Q0GBD2_9ROSI|nr:Glutamate--tRNA ligase, chloroplastic/mitochondrial [Turnera subulata]
MANVAVSGMGWARIRILSTDISPQFPFQFPHRRLCQFGRPHSTMRFSVSANSDHDHPVRVRFAPSPTGNLHVGGARTALFNYLFARSKGGKFVLRIEDTDLERSTRESEDAHYALKLLESGHVYRCFCSNDELEKMKEIAKLKQLPPVYTGKWATATEEQVQEELAKGTPYTYRFRVPKEGSLKINDLIRGEALISKPLKGSIVWKLTLSDSVVKVSWNLDTLGDFVIMRSNGQPVYNFCVTVDDATMSISHVIRAEEHLPNTLRQALIYKALGFPMPYFAHVSLILAPDRSKLSKRHGATSVGQGDGISAPGNGQLSCPIRWMNGQHLRALPSEKLTKMIGERWKKTGILIESEGPFVDEAVQLLKDGIDLVTDADKVLSNLLSYPLHETLTSREGKALIDEKLPEISSRLLAAYDDGELLSALEEGHSGWQKWVKDFGKSLKLKGKSLFMPLRVLITGKLHGPDMGHGVVLLRKAETHGIVSPDAGFVTLDERFRMVRKVDWEALRKDEAAGLEATDMKDGQNFDRDG